VSTLDELCPGPPDWEVDWSALVDRFEWARAMGGCAQDPAFHSEGDVGTHTRMVCEALAQLSEFRQLERESRLAVFWAAALHDVGKPARTRVTESGHISSRGHSAAGERTARRWLWGLGVPFASRERIVALVRAHEMPFFVLDDPDPRARVYRLSWKLRCDRLALVAEADALGRRCRNPHDRQEALDNVALFREYCVEHACLDRPRRFASAHARFVYFQRSGRDPDHEAYDDTRCEAVLLSGLPAAGKDTWAAEHAGDSAVISLDAVRAELGVSPRADQGAVVGEARERARALLRQGRGLVWNATNLSRPIRERLVSLFADYHARVRIVYLEAPEPELRQRNRERADPVPNAALEKMLSRWSVPDITEAQAVEHLVEE